MKTCRLCDQTLPETEFHQNGKSIRGQCKKCACSERRRQRAENKKPKKERIEREYIPIFKPSRGKSKYRGVSEYNFRDTHKWQATIGVSHLKLIGPKGKIIIQKHLGIYDTEQEAAEAYNRWTLIIHGKKAILNEIN